MSFTQRYKLNIMDLLNKNMNRNIKSKNKIKIRKINCLNQNNKNKLHIVNLKHSIHIKDLTEKKSFTPIHHINISINNMHNTFSIFSNKKINKETNRTNIYKKKFIPIFKINYRNIRKKNCFSFDKSRIENNHNCYNNKLLRNIDDEIKKDIDKNIKNILLKNNAKYKMENKMERINFYKRIQKAYDDINIINKRNLYINKSLFLFTPINGIYQKMSL